MVVFAVTALTAGRSYAASAGGFSLPTIVTSLFKNLRDLLQPKGFVSEWLAPVAGFWQRCCAGQGCTRASKHKHHMQQWLQCFLLRQRILLSRSVLTAYLCWWFWCGPALQVASMRCLLVSPWVSFCGTTPALPRRFLPQTLALWLCCSSRHAGQAWCWQVRAHTLASYPLVFSFLVAGCTLSQTTSPG
jgi:hypothetical protein